MFNIPKDAEFGDDFDEAALEDELHAIIGDSQPLSSRASKNVNQERFSQAASDDKVRKKNEPMAKPNQNAYDLSAMMGNLNLEAPDDDDFDEDDPELNAQLASFLGDDLPAYSSKKPAAVANQPAQPSVKPSRPAPVPANRPVSDGRPADANCVQLENSHFFAAKPQQLNEQRTEPISQIEQLIRLKDEYKALALNAKRANEIENAKEYLKKMREVETALESMKGGNPSGAPPKAQAPPDSQAPSANKTTEGPKQAGSLVEELEQRRQKIESLMQKEQSMNNVPKVKMMTRVIKQYDSAIKAAKSGRQFDYASLPPTPGFGDLPLERFSKPSGGQLPQIEPNQPFTAGQAAQASHKSTTQPTQANIQPNNQANNQASKIRQLEKQRDEYKMLALNAKKQNDIENAKLYLLKMKEVNALIENSNGEQQKIGQKIEPAKPAASSKSILEELEQRKAKFESILQRESAQNNTSRVRVIGRVLKQYDAAIGTCKAGKEFDYESLPIPPGFEQLPKSESDSREEPKVSAPSAEQPSQPSQTPANKPPFKRTVSINNRQLDYLLQRQKLFKEAAVESNKKGDTTQALDYLRKAKGFTPLITAVENGLPIDVSNIPVPPQLDSDDFVMVTSESSGTLSGANLEKEEHYRKLELELEKQISLCAKNKDHFYKIGDVSTGSKFEKYLVDMRKDFELLRAYKQRNDEVPKYRYERKSFSIVVCNADVSINECVVEVMRAIDLPCKTPVDSYVRFEFPFPKDAPQPAKTHSIKNSLYPEFNQTFRFSIDRKSRSLARVFNKSMKFEILTKGGLFRSDELIGHISVDLKVLLNKCTIFESFPILNGRKEIGGKICLKIKLREPLLSKQVEEIREKWLVFD